MNNARSIIILVDDNMTNLTVGKNMLSTFYKVIPAPSAAKMFEALEKVTPDLILLDIDMPQMDGYEAIKKLKADGRFVDIPVIFLTAKNDPDSELEGFDLGAVDYITKPFSAPLLIKRIEKELLIIETQAKLKDYLGNLENKVLKKTQEVMHLQNAVLATVVDMVEFRDKYTGWHIIRTQRYLGVLLEEMVEKKVYIKEIAGWDINSVMSAAKLHDVGKIAVSDLILGKEAKLTEEEFENMKLHVAAGIDAIERIISNTDENDFLNHALRIAGTHHEKWDGKGYPMGLKGNNIPLEGRLMAIADVYDALISVRPYKAPLSHEEACKIIEDSSGTHFDPILVDVFRNIKDKFEQIAQEVGFDR